VRSHGFVRERLSSGDQPQAPGCDPNPSNPSTSMHVFLNDTDLCLRECIFPYHHLSRIHVHVPSTCVHHRWDWETEMIVVPRNTKILDEQRDPKYHVMIQTTEHFAKRSI
jgi:hypothetical protein